MNCGDGGEGPVEEVSARNAWARVAAALKAEIVEGVMARGARLPSETSIAERFEVGRGTVRRALATLQADGFIRTEQGRGSFVQEVPYPYGLTRSSRFCHTLNRINVPQARATVRHALVDGNGRIGGILGARSGDRLALIEVLNFAEGLPVLVASNFLPAARFPGIADAYEREQSLSAALRRYGMAVQERAYTEITSRLPTADEAKLLRQPRTNPITEVENVVVDGDRTASWVEVLCFAADRVRLVLDR